ncbi:hypothetical protein PG997_005096 [Apiospora hydei]|uniref:Uncharacterized protein n=1 Tax=Apiospora hydei TaxID=1337664 RepID=A0ABR1X3Z2_9PEZI
MFSGEYGAWTVPYGLCYGVHEVEGELTYYPPGITSTAAGPLETVDEESAIGGESSVDVAARECKGDVNMQNLICAMWEVCKRSPSTAREVRVSKKKSETRYGAWTAPPGSKFVTTAAVVGVLAVKVVS